MELLRPPRKIVNTALPPHTLMGVWSILEVLERGSLELIRAGPGDLRAAAALVGAVRALRRREGPGRRVDVMLWRSCWRSAARHDVNDPRRGGPAGRLFGRDRRAGGVFRGDWRRVEHFVVARGRGRGVDGAG